MILQAAAVAENNDRNKSVFLLVCVGRGFLQGADCLNSQLATPSVAAT